jgi:hypothetical protein
MDPESRHWSPETNRQIATGQPNSVTDYAGWHNGTGRETLERLTRLVQVVIVNDIQPVRRIQSCQERNFSRTTSPLSSLLLVPTCRVSGLRSASKMRQRRVDD